jgi:hypothetical protein
MLITGVYNFSETFEPRLYDHIHRSNSTIQFTDPHFTVYTGQVAPTLRAGHFVGWFRGPRKVPGISCEA